MRKLFTFAVLLLVGVGFWIFLGDSPPSTRHSSAPDAGAQKEQELRERLRSYGRIVFVRDGNLWIMQGDGSRQMQLTKSGSDRLPAWSPAGNCIAYLQDEPGDPDSTRIRVMDPDSGRSRQISTTTTLYSSPPAWCPDGSRIAFTHPALDDAVLHYEVRVIDVESGKEVLLGGGQGPSWSRDCKRLVASTLGIVDTSTPEKSSPIPQGSGFTWSPLDNRIAFSWSVKQGALYSMDLHGNVLDPLSQRDESAVRPLYSRHGDSIVYASALDGQIHLVDWLGKQAKVLGEGKDPVWTWDDKGLFFCSAEGQITYMDADGKNPTNLSASATFDGQPTLEPPPRPAD